MELKVIIEEELYTLNVPDQLIEEATDFFDKMDADMDAGIQMSRTWVENPDKIQRLQAVANKLLTALETGNENLGRMMAAYILSRAPNIDLIDMDTSGDMTTTEIRYKEGASPVSFGMPPMLDDPFGMDPALREAAEKQVSKVFKQGRVYSFSLLNGETGEWETAIQVKDQEQAETQREQAVLAKMRELAH
ncbi:MAG: hypothetical protein P8Z78_00215 [Gammaproteobacteria bacterium]|jgi:hypothetical protein